MKIGELWRRLWFLVNRERFSAELDEEIRLHTEFRAARLLEKEPRDGETANFAEALTVARKRFGNATSLQEASRDVWAIRWLEDSLRDAGFALRQLRKTPGITAVAVLSLALGIGANTAIFTLIQSTLLRPIAVKHGDQLRLLGWRHHGGGWVAPRISSLSPAFGWMYEQNETADGGLIHTAFSPPMYEEFLRDNTVFESLFAFKEIGRTTAVVDGIAESVNCFLVSGDFYRGLEVEPVIGRPIRPENDVQTQGGQVVLISYEYWTRRFARSPSAIGKTIMLNDVPVTIIGVNPEYFTGIQPGANFEIWTPLNLAPSSWVHSPLDDAHTWSIPMMGRLKPGISDSQAQAALNAIFQNKLDVDYPGIKTNQRPEFILQSGERGIDYLGERYEQPLMALFALAGLVLLIACANVANLLLAKSAARQREISLRLSLGADRWRIVRQLFTEGLLLASMAGVAGVIVGFWTRNSIPALLATPWRPSPFDTTFDPKVLLASIGMTFLTGVLFSLAPVWQSRRVDVNESLKDGSRGAASLSKLRLGRLLVVLQVALSVLLLAGTGLCVETFANLRRTPLGFHPEGVLLFTLDPPGIRYPADRVSSLLTELQERLGAIPGVQSATFSGNRGGGWIGPGNDKPQVTFTSYAPSFDAGSRFFKTMGIRILYGRAIDEQDRLSGPRAVVVNQEFGKHFFHKENAAGETFTGYNPVPGKSYGTTESYRIVGVCADWRVDQTRAPIRSAFYGYLIPGPRAGPMTFELKIAGNVNGVAQQIRKVVRSTDRNLVVTDLRTELQQIEDSLSEERLLASLAAVFGALALSLSMIGVYGVMAYGVARRTNEIGIRVALGALPGSVARMVLRETLMLALAGVAIGVPAVLGLSPVLNHALAPAYREGFAYGMKPNDPLTIALAVLVLAGAGITAGYFPARRAARIDPMAALRHD